MAGVLVALFVVHALLSARHKTPTVDEFAHVPAGYLGLATGDFSLYGKTPPLARSIFSIPLLVRQPTLPEPPPGSRMAGWYPWSYATGFFAANVREHGIDFVGRVYRDARFVVVLFGATLGVLLFLWGRRLHGGIGGLIALIIYTFDPNVLAHSRLATVDIPETLLFFAAVGAFIFHLDRPKGMRLVAAGLLTGAALATKFTALLLAPILAGLSLAHVLLTPRVERRDAVRRTARALLVVLLLTLAVVNASYLFGDSFRLLGSFQFRSGLLSGVQQPWLSWVPVPFPGDFVRGFDAQQVDLEVGDFPNYLNGRWSREGWWYYYPLALLVKTPVPVTLLLVITLGLWGARRLERRPRRSGPREAARRTAAVGLPETAHLRRLWGWGIALGIGVPLFAACFLNRLDIGVRYVLPIYPFAFLGMASLGRLARRKEPVAAGLLAAAVATAVVSTVSVFPHYLGYFNFLAGGMDRGWTVLSNSNNDWGQDLITLREELRRRGSGPVRLAYFGHAEPSAYGIEYTVPLPGASGADALRPGRGRFPHSFAPGLYAISVNLLVGFPYQVMDHGRWVPAGTTLSEPQQIFAWFRRRPPDAVLGGSILLYDVEGGSP